MIAGVLGEHAGHTPGTRRVKSSRVKRVVRALGGLAESQRCELSFDLAIDNVRPVPLDAHEGCSRGPAEGAVPILPAGLHRRVNLIVQGFMTGRRIELGETDSQSALAGKED